MIETQETINAWAEATFGPVVSRLRIAERADKEMQELLQALREDDNHPKALEEAVDVFIILLRLFPDDEQFWDHVEAKMAICRGRTWVLNGDGTGQHA